MFKSFCFIVHIIIIVVCTPQWAFFLVWHNNRKLSIISDCIIIIAIALLSCKCHVFMNRSYYLKWPKHEGALNRVSYKGLRTIISKEVFPSEHCMSCTGEVNLG